MRLARTPGLGRKGKARVALGGCETRGGPEGSGVPAHQGARSFPHPTQAAGARGGGSRSTLPRHRWSRAHVGLGSKGKPGTALGTPPPGDANIKGVEVGVPGFLHSTEQM